MSALTRWTAKGLLLLLMVIAREPTASAQLIVVQPSELAEAFPKARIEGSTAAFGTPYYGERIAGNLLFFDKPGCEDDDYHFEISHEDALMANSTGLQTASGARDVTRSGLRTVVMVRRGECHFVTKVMVAEKKGATAVVIVDKEGSMSTSKDVKTIIMADDGWGDSIVVPSLLIGEVDGLLLIKELMKGNRVIIELAWDVPKASPVQMDQWISPAFADTNKFLKEFAPYAKQLKHKLNYRPHYVVITLPGDFKEMCTDQTGNFCGWDPDKGGKTTGKEIMQETVRQLCLWQVSQTLDESDPESGYYAERWWSYVEQLGSVCPHKGNVDQDATAGSALGLSREDFEAKYTLGEQCSYNLMEELGANVNQVKRCYTHNFDMLLTQELFNKAWSSTAVMINDWRYSGSLDPEVITRTLCTGFNSRPKECSDLFHPSRAELFLDGLIVESVEGFPLWAVVVISCVAVLLGIVIALLLYWYCIHPKVRSHLRYAIMDEVRKESSANYDARSTATTADLEPPSRGFVGSGVDGRPVICIPANPGCSPSPSPVNAAGGGQSNKAEPLGRQFYGFDQDEYDAELKRERFQGGDGSSTKAGSFEEDGRV